MADTLESLEIEVKHNANGADAAISKVVSQIEAMGRALSSVLPQLKQYAATIGSIGGKAPSKGAKSASAAASPLDNGLQETIKNASKLEVAIHKAAAAGLGLEDAFQNGDVEGAWRQRERELNAIAQAARESAKQADGARRANNGAASSVKSLSRAAAKAKSPLESFVASLKRIAMYRIMRSIIKSITQGFQEGLEWAYNFSKGVQGEGNRFAAAMDSMKAAGNTMKLQLGSAFISLLALIAPIVNTIISLVTTLANALSQLFAVFTGGTYLKANDAAADLADQMKAGSGAAKEWKNQLLGFDVINRLNEPSGGGGGGGAADASNLFEDTEITGWFALLKAKWDALINSINFEPILAAWARLKAAVADFVSIVNRALLWAWNNVLVPLAHWTIEKAAPAVVNLLASAFEFLNAVLRKLGPVFQKLWDSILKPFFSWIGGALVKAINWLTETLESLTKKVTEAHSIGEFLQSLDGKEKIILGVAAAIVVLGTAFLIFNTINALIAAFGAIITAITSPIGIAVIVITALIVAGIALYENWDFIVNGIKNALDRMKTGFSEAFDTIEAKVHAFGDKIKSAINSINEFLLNVFVNSWKNAWNSVVNFLKSVYNVVNSIVLAIVRAIMMVASAINSLRMGMAAFTTTSAVLGVNGYATGGFPEDGLFFANHGELVGQFSNGKTAVANNAQIIDGIKQGVYEAMTMAAGTGRSGNHEVVLNVNGKEFARAIYNDQKAVAKEHGVSMISY